MYLDRIAIPHATLEETFSSLSSFISSYEPEDYEKSMVHCNSIAATTRKLLSERESFEQSLVRALLLICAFNCFITFILTPQSMLPEINMSSHSFCEM